MKYDLSNFRPMIDSSNIKLTICNSAVFSSVGLNRAIIAMRANKIELMRNDEGCICLHVTKKRETDRQLSLYEAEQLALKEIRRMRNDIFDIYGIDLPDDDKLMMNGIYDPMQDAIFFPKDKIELEVKRRRRKK